LELKKPLFFPTTHTKEYSMSQSLLEMTTDLVLAQIQAHRLSPDEMQTALQHTYSSLLALQVQEDANGIVAAATPETQPEPVNWKKSITKHTVTCLECGRSFKQLSVRHLREHALDGQSYRVKYGIPPSQPLSARAVTAMRQQIVQQSRPWERAPTYLKAQEKAKQVEAQKTRQVQRKGKARTKA
jgi:predicted transcriptional regulator